MTDTRSPRGDALMALSRKFLDARNDALVGAGGSGHNAVARLVDAADSYILAMADALRGLPGGKELPARPKIAHMPFTPQNDGFTVTDADRDRAFAALTPNQVVRIENALYLMMIDALTEDADGGMTFAAAEDLAAAFGYVLDGPIEEDAPLPAFTRAVPPSPVAPRCTCLPLQSDPMGYAGDCPVHGDDAIDAAEAVAPEGGVTARCSTCGVVSPTNDGLNPMWHFVGTGLKPGQPSTVEYWFHDLCRPSWLTKTQIYARPVREGEGR